MMTEISSFTALPRKPRLHVTIVGPFGIGDREHETRRAIEEPELEQIDAQECAGAVRDAGQERYLAIRSGELFGAERRVLIDTTDRVLQPRHRIVQQRILQPR